jgi:hypothetical protein
LRHGFRMVSSENFFDSSPFLALLRFSTRAGLHRTTALPLACSLEQGVDPNYGSPDFFCGGQGQKRGER